MSGNPNPQHNPTDGLGVAAFVQLSGTGVTALNTVSTNHPNPGPYSLTLSLTAAGGHAATCQLTTSLVDVSNASYSPVGSARYRSYNDPANKAGSAPSWYNPSNFSSTAAPVQSYDPNVASVNSTGLITSRAVGHAVIEVAFPTFDNTLGNDPNTSGDAGMLGEPKNFIYAQVIVTVIP